MSLPGFWPCDWAGASSVRLRLPAEPPAPPQGGQLSFPPVPTVRHQAQAELTASELQDLVDALPEILKAGAGLDLRFVLRLELGDSGEPAEEQLAQLREALKRASDKLDLQ